MSIEMPYSSTQPERGDVTERFVLIVIAGLSAVGCALAGLGIYNASPRLTEMAGVVGIVLFGALGVAILLTIALVASRAFSASAVVESVDSVVDATEVVVLNDDEADDGDLEPVPGDLPVVHVNPVSPFDRLKSFLENDKFIGYRRRLRPSLSADSRCLVIHAPQTTQELSDCRDYDQQMSRLLRERAIAHCLYIDSKGVVESDLMAVESVLRTLLQVREARHADQRCYLIDPPHSVRLAMKHLTADEDWELPRSEFVRHCSRLFSSTEPAVPAGAR